MSVNDSRAKLARATKDLFIQWRETTGVWRDENARRFEKKYLDYLQAELQKTAVGMQQIDAVINRIKHDCG